MGESALGQARREAESEFPEFAQYLKELGYSMAVQLRSGEWLALEQFMYTTGLMVIGDGDLFGYRCRFCYENIGDAIKAWMSWDGEGDDPGGPWVKQKGRDSFGRPVDRLNPRLADPDAEF
jgi:hypothetical protein